MTAKRRGIAPSYSECHLSVSIVLLEDSLAAENPSLDTQYIKGEASARRTSTWALSGWFIKGSKRTARRHDDESIS